MARIAGIDLPKNKRAFIGLTYIYGIGKQTAIAILESCNISLVKRIQDLTEGEINMIRKEIENKYPVEGALRGQISMNLKRLMDISCYRGLRHRVGLPVRGQRTRTNSRTRKGPKRYSVGKKR
ncbi:MAG: 30S ribosomal protein S13 [Candidatus Delongbacteria bacterium]|nr:30S ribosomal protein S13 [Candidatus Delongbacteria bacterium]